MHGIHQAGGGGAGGGQTDGQARYAKAPAGGGGAMSGRKVVGNNVRKVDGYTLVTGAPAFTDDIEMQGMLYGKILPSPYAHARIKRIDTRKAKALGRASCRERA